MSRTKTIGMWRALAIAMVLAAPVFAVDAAPLQPSDKWHLHYLESTCTAQRRFGEYALAFEAPPIGEGIRLVVTGPGSAAEHTRQLESLIDLDDGGPPIRTSSLLYKRPIKGQRGLTTVLTPDDATRVANSKQLQISTIGSGPKSTRRAPSGQPVFKAEFAIGSTAALAREIRKCVEDLRKHWGIVGGEPPEPAQKAKIRVQGLFKPSDYPRDAMDANQTGSTTFLLMIDDKGRIIDCLIKETSRVASIDFMGCQVIRERAKAEPAKDTAGKPVKSIYMARVSWAIRG